MSRNGHTKNEWMSKDVIEMIDPIFFLDRTNRTAKLPIDKPDETKQIDDAFECNICQTKIKRRDHFLAHIRQKHSGNSEQFACPVCDTKYGYKSKFNSTHDQKTSNISVNRIFITVATV